MYPRPFRFLRAASVEEASELLATHGDGAKLLAGGQSLMPMINLGLIEPEVLIDITGISGLDFIRRDDGRVVLGPLVRYRSIEESAALAQSQPLLADAVRHVGNRRVRNSGTLGGSVAHGDPAAELPLALTVLEAEYTISTGQSSRQVAATDFAVTFFTTQLQPAELITRINIPVLPDGWGWGFQEFAQRTGDFALVAAMAVVRCQGDIVHELRLGLAGVSDKPVRCRSQERAASGRWITEVVEAVATVGQELQPPDDAFVSAEYRTHLAGVLASRAVADACSRSQRSQP